MKYWSIKCMYPYHSVYLIHTWSKILLNEVQCQHSNDINVTTFCPTMKFGIKAELTAMRKPFGQLLCPMSR